MDGDNSGDNLRKIMEAIKSSELVETRIELTTRLGVAVPTVDSEVDSLLEFLATLWEGFTCLDVSQCMLNRSILDVASKCLRGCSSSIQGRILILGVQASDWCVKHLKMTLMSTDDSQEEDHYMMIFLQLVLHSLNFSVDCFSLAIRNPLFEDELLMTSLDKFICEALKLVKELTAELKKIHLLRTELLKAAELVIDNAVKLCKVYAQSVSWDLYSTMRQEDSSSLDNKEVTNLIHVANLLKQTVEKLFELGVLAANSGGSLVTILNLSLKGVVSLLQLAGGTLADKVNVGGIILNLVSLAADSLRCAAQTWFTSLDQTISVNEAKRVFLPIKFYLINAVRISSQYPHQAFSVYQEVTQYILLLTSLRAAFGRETNLKNVCEAMEELLKPTSLHLLKSLLNSAQLGDYQKLQILDWLFSPESHSLSNGVNHIHGSQKSSFDEFFSVDCETLPSARTVLLARVVLFSDLLKVSFDLDGYVIHGITRKLQWFLDALVDEVVYSVVLSLQIPASCGEGKCLELTWEPVLFSFINALKIFMILVSGTQGWSEIELFLLDNFFHSHSLCWEIIMELWCFFVRYADSGTADAVMDKLFSLYKSLALSDSPFPQNCRLRRMARSLCLVLASCAPCTVDHIYKSIVTDDRPNIAVVMHAGLLMEGFQLNLLSESMRARALGKIFQDYAYFVNDYIENPINSCSSSTLAVPALVLCSALQSMQIDASTVDTKTLEFLLLAIQAYKTSTDSAIKNHCCRLLSEGLSIVSSAKHLYGNDQMEQVIFELENMFISGATGGESELHKCKPALAKFVSSLGHVAMAECEESTKTSAIWQLYHMLFRERHWALIHHAVSAFGYFAAHTSCHQLWRFVPPDAALSFDVAVGNDAKEERFMSELKVFLEKESALDAAVANSAEQHELLVKDGIILKELLQKNLNRNSDSMVCESTDNNGGNSPNKRRKLPDGLDTGMQLLQNGLKIISDGLCQWQQHQQDYAELDDKVFSQLSHLENVVNYFSGLTGSG